MKELKRLFPYFKKYKYHFIFGSLFITISNISYTYVPRVVGNAIDQIQTKDFQLDFIYEKILIILALTFFGGVFLFLTRRTIIVGSRLIEYDFRNDFLTAIQKQKMSFFDRESSGSIMALLVNDISAVREFIGPAIMYGANTLSTFVFALYFMLTLNVGITILSLLPLPFIALATYFLGRKIHSSFKKVQQQFSVISEQAQEIFSGIRIIKSYNSEKIELNRFQQQNIDYYEKNIRLVKIYSLITPIFLVLIGISQLFILGYGGNLVINQKATLGDLVQFFIYLSLLIWPVAAIGWVTNLIQRASASMARLGKILDLNEDVEDIDKYNIDFKVRGDINFENVYLKYKDKNYYSLEDITINIPSGTSLGVVGPIGSGKSSLIKVLPRLYDIEAGAILLDNLKIDEIPLKNLRENIGIAPQEPFLFTLSILENIRFGKTDASLEEVEEVCKIAEFHNDVMLFPDKYETLLGERGITLSGGQKQRLAIARALLRNPKILILDDALSSVDAETAEKILGNLKNVMTKRTTIIISHRISNVKDCDMIIYLDNGRIIEQGTHNELLNLNKNYAKMFKRQLLEAELETY